MVTAKFSTGDGWKRSALRAAAVSVARAALLAACVLTAGVAPASAEFESYAIVRDDASLLIRGKVVRLSGIYVPDLGTFCGRTLRPAQCKSRAAVALDFKIQRFVRCVEVAEYGDGSLAAYCTVNHTRFSAGEDLGSYLIGQGLALAGPDAPFEYRALERIAEANGRGVWGFQADSIRVR